jgi:hypothetical protein
MPIKTTDSLDVLAALNIMASYVGIPPLTNLVNIADEPDFLLAQEILDELTSTTLSQGLPCNTDYEFPLTEQDGSGYTIIPAGSLITDIITDGYVERDGLVYNLDTRLFETSVSLKATVVWNMDYDNLPELVKRYIAIAASRVFVNRVKGDGAMDALTIPDERRVKQEFQRYVYAVGDLTILQGDVPYQIARSGRNYFRGRY